jgi:hypothetical protein
MCCVQTALAACIVVIYTTGSQVFFISTMQGLQRGFSKHLQLIIHTANALLLQVLLLPLLPSLLCRSLLLLLQLRVHSSWLLLLCWQ